ncbi:MAG: thioredoxin [Omnitrophica WOR_2 bacterium RBG_13_44_8b]|nr:MAG: thioredoxin [Omnitrophica WOR_2 bacterium RBG_13_44_8b]
MEIMVNDKNFKQEVLESGLPVLVDFWAVWCGPCLMVAPAVEAMAKKYKGKLKVCKVNVDEAPNTSSEYGIMSIPTLAIFKKGKVADKVVGALPESELEAAIKKHI